MNENDRHYLSAIKSRLEQLYNEHPNDPSLREKISDEVDWIDEKLGTSAGTVLNAEEC